MADTQRQDAPTSSIGGAQALPEYDNQAFAQQGTQRRDQQMLEQWQKDNARSLGGFAATVKEAALDSGSTAWDFIGRQLDSSRRAANAKHKEQGFDYWSDPRRKDWEAGLTDDELSMVHGVADKGYVDVILAMDRVNRGRDFSELMGRQNGVVATVGAIIGGATDPAGLLAGAGIGAAFRAASSARTASRAVTAAQAALAKPTVAGAVYRTLGEGAEQVAGSLLTDGAMNVIGEYRSKDDMEMNALASFVLGTTIRGVGEGYGLLKERNKSGGKLRQETSAAADESVGRMADTAEHPVDLELSPKEHAENALTTVAKDATEAARPGRRFQVFDDAEQTRLREEFEGAEPTVKDTQPPARPVRDESAVESPTLPEGFKAQQELESVDVPEHAYEDAALDFDTVAVDRQMLDAVVESAGADPEAVIQGVTKAMADLDLSPEGKAHGENLIKIAEETRTAQYADAADAVNGKREPRVFLDDGTEVTLRSRAATLEEAAASGRVGVETGMRAVTHREVLEALAASTRPGATEKVVQRAASWLLRSADSKMLDSARTHFDFAGSRGESFADGSTAVSVKDAAGAVRQDWATAPTGEIMENMGTWSRATVVHEIVHSATARTLQALEDADITGTLAKFSPEIRAAYSTLKEYQGALAEFKGAEVGSQVLAARDSNSSQGHHYAAKNIHEFVAQAMSDTATQLALSSMRPLGKFHYFANALDHVLSSVRDLLVRVGWTAKQANERTGYTEVAEAIDLVVRANTRDRMRILTEAEASAKVKAQAAAEAIGPLQAPEATKTEWSAAQGRETKPTPKDNAHVNYMTGGFYKDVKSLVEARRVPGVGVVGTFNTNVPNNARLLSAAREIRGKWLKDATVLLSDRMATAAHGGGSDSFKVGTVHIIGIAPRLGEQASGAALARELGAAVMHRHAGSPTAMAGLRKEVVEWVQSVSGDITAPRKMSDFVPSEDAKPAVAALKGMFEDAKRINLVDKDAEFTDVLEDILREAEAAPAQREKSFRNPLGVTSATDKLRTALEKQADSFFDTNSLEVARTSTAAGKYTTFISDGLVMARSKNKIMRMLSAVVAETTTGGVAVRQTTAAVRKAMLKSRLIGSDLFTYNNAYGEWRPKGATSVWDDVFVGDNRRKFDREVVTEILERRRAWEAGDKRTTDHVNPAVRRAADSIQAMADRARQEQIRANTLGTAALGDSSVGYLPQRLDGQRLLAASQDELNALRGALATHWQSVYPNWDNYFAKEFSRYYVERAQRRARGAEADMVQAEQSGTREVREALEDMGSDPTLSPENRKKIGESIRGLGHTKGRLDIDLLADIGNGKRIMDFYVTDPQRLMSSYADRVSGDIALTEVGILGRSGRHQLMRVLETSQDVTEQELAAVKRVVAEIVGEPTQGYRNKALSNLRMLTGLSRLGGLAWNQLAETMNATHMLGLDAMLKGIPRLPAMFGEVRRIVNGQKVENPWLDSFKGVVSDYGTEGYYMHFPSDPPDARLADYAEQSGLTERLLRKGSHLQAKLSLFRAVHGAQHRWVAEQIVRKAALYITDAAAGKRGTERWLKDMGFTPEMVEATKAHIAKAVTYDAKGNLLGFDLAKLGTYELQADFAASVHRGVAQIIQGSFAGERSAWMHNDVGLMLGQFRSFTATAMEKQWARTRYVVGEDTHVAGAYGYIAGLIAVQAGMGALLHTARVGLASTGRREEDREDYLSKRLTPWELSRAALNYSSASGAMGEVMDLSGVIGGAFFDETMKDLGRYQSRNQTPGRGGGGDVLDLIPSVGYVRDASKAAQGALATAAQAMDPDQEVKKLGRTLRDSSRLLPGANLPPATILLDQLRRLDELPNE